MNAWEQSLRDNGIKPLPICIDAVPREYGVPREQVQSWVDEGRVASVRVQGRTLIRREDLEALL
jgi:hypothetical protein